MRVTNTFRMADRLLDGRLAEVILQYRADNVSPEEIARQLFSDYGVQVTASTIRRWAAQLTEGAA